MSPRGGQVYRWWRNSEPPTLTRRTVRHCLSLFVSTALDGRLTESPTLTSPIVFVHANYGSSSQVFIQSDLICAWKVSTVRVSICFVLLSQLSMAHLLDRNFILFPERKNKQINQTYQKKKKGNWWFYSWLTAAAQQILPMPLRNLFTPLCLLPGSESR